MTIQPIVVMPNINSASHFLDPELCSETKKEDCEVASIVAYEEVYYRKLEVE